MNTAFVSRLFLASSLTATLAVGAKAQCHQWRDIPGVPAGSSITVLGTFNSGPTTDLYAGGTFTMIGGVAANRIARWNGATWSPLGSGLNGTVESLLALEGISPALFVGGRFTLAGSTSVPGVARWNGSGDRNSKRMTPVRG